MDGQRFDNWTRQLATRCSRRTLLRGLAGGALAAVGLGRVSEASCPRDQPINCGGTCVDLRTNPTNCGRCGTVCSSGLCYAGRCMDACPSGFVRHDGTCYRTCPDGMAACNGVCVSACRADQVFDAACACVCPGALTECNGACVDLLANPAHCGACDNVCPAPAQATAVCDAGSCTFVCDAVFQLCDGACIPATACCTDADCTEGPIGATATCESGTCSYACPMGTRDCDGICQACCSDDDCETGELCVEGVCLVDLGYTCADAGVCASEICCPPGEPRAGLCGLGIGEDCGTNNNACCSASCVEGVCRAQADGVAGAVCDVGDIADCQGAPGLDCCIDYDAPISPTGFACTDLSTDPNHCGACNVACPAGQTCEDGACVCPTGTVECDGVCQGCCTDDDCPAGPDNTEPTCDATTGTCDYPCAEGYIPDNGACVLVAGDCAATLEAAGCSETDGVWDCMGRGFLPGASLAGCDLSDADFAFFNFNGATLSGANLTGATLNNADMNDVILSSATLDQASLRSAFAFRANLTNASLRNADLTLVNLTFANLTGADLTGANLTGVNWSNATCPNGTNSSTTGGTCCGQLNATPSAGC